MGSIAGSDNYSPTVVGSGLSSLNSTEAVVISILSLPSHHIGVIGMTRALRLKSQYVCARLSCFLIWAWMCMRDVKLVLRIVLWQSY